MVVGSQLRRFWKTLPKPAAPTNGPGRITKRNVPTKSQLTVPQGKLKK